ncbi:type III toxin-antitoxin system TenpIN family toxin [Rugamonas apoptosis]|uniref:Uncharacterized protein n=1 Tax=Rugamonas apoptosis TaxID=2758570 RepID=A0A7W2F6W5_9BURK|nr:hypothetical protein [Rugamonas apoptosis]MBA5686084.1 hypothetical protein [Rugamonas apoptosis]
MEVKKLNEVFYEENKHLVEVMDKTGTQWTGDKTRGYGIVLVEVNGLKFGIPLRSNMRPYNGFITAPKESKGLDFSKAVLLSKEEYISESEFIIPRPEFLRIKDNSAAIARDFNKYVKKYVRGASKNDSNILKDYRFTTLQNYHAELGIKPPNKE